MPPLARALCADSPADLVLAFSRMGLPAVAHESLLATLPQLQVLLTGLALEEGCFLGARCEASGRAEFPTYVSGWACSTRAETGLLTGRREQFLRLLAAIQAEEGMAPLSRALARVVTPLVAPSVLVLGDRQLVWGKRTCVMGVVNVTPDSFSDGGRHLAPEAAVLHGLALAQTGADVLDVGGESTRPGALSVSADEEIARILPVIQGLRARTDVPLSVDTTKAAVACEALAAGATLVNDVSGFQFDADLPRVVAEAGAACCLMHLQGTPATMQQRPEYGDVVAEVLAFLEAAVARAEAAGVPRERVLVDPGIGFGKTLGHNLLLLRRLVDLRQLGLPVLVGTSRKSFLGALAGGKPPSGRLPATLASVAVAAALGGADMVRVHDVAECRDALAVAEAIRGAADGGLLWGALTPVDKAPGA